MKKITKIAATFAATMAILFGAASCSHDGGASLAALSEKQEKPEGGGDTIDLTYSFKDFSNAAFTGTEAITLSSDVTLNTDTDGVKIVLLAAGNEAFGSSTITKGTESNGVTLTNDYTLKNTPSYKVNNSGTGLTIKNTCIKITGVTGNVDVAVDWCIGSKGKAANDRGVFVKVGDTIKAQGSKETPSTDDKSIKNKLEASGTASGDIYIAASNESIIETITIKSK